MAEPKPPTGVQAQVVGLTDVGRVREHNEDSFLVVDRAAGRAAGPGEVVESEVGSALLLMVCDGMGGAAAGEVASRMAAQRVSEVLSAADLVASTPDQVASLMDQAVQQANVEIFEKAKSTPEMKGMGTTLTAAVVTPGRLYVSQVGDSRAYLLRKGLLNQITKDQSLIGQLIEEGTLTEEEAEKLGGRNIVLQAVGVEDALRVDTKSWPVLRGDVLLLCSDGLSGMVKDARMREILTEAGPDLRAAADKLIAEANENGGRDNITVVLGRFDGEGLRAPMETETGTMEAAGATFRAPPPPEVPNPMKKVAAWGGVLLALVLAAFLVFRPTKAHLTVKVSPEGAKVRLLGKDGAEVRALVAGKDTLRIEGVEPGDYTLEVTAPRHFDEQRTLPIKEHGVVPLDEVSLEPKPGTLVVEASDPDVDVALWDKADHPKSRSIEGERFRLPEKGQSRETGNVPVGSWKVVASRPGFRDRVVEGRMDPEENERVLVPPLEQLTGTLVVEGCGGARVVVRTSQGEILAEGTAEGDQFERQVRAVHVVVSVSWGKGFRDVTAETDVGDGARAAVRVQKTAETVRVRVTAPPNSVVAIERRDGARWSAVKTVRTDASGAASSQNLGPGSYRLRLEDGTSSEFEVPPGKEEVSVSVGTR